MFFVAKARSERRFQRRQSGCPAVSYPRGKFSRLFRRLLSESVVMYGLW